MDRKQIFQIESILKELGISKRIMSVGGSDNSITYQADKMSNKVHILKVRIGKLPPSHEAWELICKKYKYAKTAGERIFVILHEIGHTKMSVSALIRTRWMWREIDFDELNAEQYRNLPREKFADAWANNFIKRNPETIARWRAMLEES